MPAWSLDKVAIVLVLPVVISFVQKVIQSDFTYAFEVIRIVIMIIITTLVIKVTLFLASTLIFILLDHRIALNNVESYRIFYCTMI